ncbi:hypothetical protein [Anoxybacterium hadale]
MGEIIFSLFVGGWMILTGIFMNWWLLREEKNTRQKKTAEGRN